MGLRTRAALRAARGAPGGRGGGWAFGGGRTSGNIQTLTTMDCKGPQTNMPKNVGSIKT